jgi:membrane protease YdiL (CAAX protease family)
VFPGGVRLLDLDSTPASFLKLATMNGACAEEGAGARLAEAAKARLWAELALFFVGLPFLLFLVPYGQIVAALVVLLAALYCWRWLKACPRYDSSRLFLTKDFCRHLLRTLSVFLPLGAFALVLAYFYTPEGFLAFPRREPLLFAALLIGYPVFSAYPQEVIFRAYFYERFRPILPRTWQLVAMNVLLFGWVHIFFGMWIMPVLGAAGAALFSRTYFRSGSLLQTAIEHGLWGLLLLSSGIGWALFTGLCG